VLESSRAEELGHLLYMFPCVFKVGGDEVANVMHAQWFHTFLVSTGAVCDTDFNQ
jgi:hypothetical protein